MSRTNRAPSDLADAAAVHAARERIIRALGPLAARPLDEDVVEQMREALDHSDSPAVRAAVRRMARPSETRPNLVVVTAGGERASQRRQEPPDHSPLLALAASRGDTALAPACVPAGTLPSSTTTSLLPSPAPATCRRSLREPTR